MDFLFKISWSYNKQLIKIQNDRDIIISTESDMHMYMIKFEINECECGRHDGVYQILAKNTGGEAVCTIQVNIKGKDILSVF